RSIALELRSSIDQHQLPILNDPVPPGIVQQAAVETGAEDRIIGQPPSARLAESVLENLLQLPLAHSGLDFAHRLEMTLDGDFACSRQLLELPGLLDRAHPGQHADCILNSGPDGPFASLGVNLQDLGYGRIVTDHRAEKVHILLPPRDVREYRSEQVA